MRCPAKEAIEAVFMSAVKEVAVKHNIKKTQNSVQVTLIEFPPHTMHNNASELSRTDQKCLAEKFSWGLKDFFE